VCQEGEREFRDFVKFGLDHHHVEITPHRIVVSVAGDVCGPDPVTEGFEVSRKKE
jgi:hypothetical protein